MKKFFICWMVLVAVCVFFGCKDLWFEKIPVATTILITRMIDKDEVLSGKELSLYAYIADKDYNKMAIANKEVEFTVKSKKETLLTTKGITSQDGSVHIRFRPTRHMTESHFWVIEATSSDLVSTKYNVRNVP